jgi:hypothetical protein
MLDVPDAQMRRLGRWDSSRMTKHYSSGLPRQGARILGGHGQTAGIYLLGKTPDLAQIFYETTDLALFELKLQF